MSGSGGGSVASGGIGGGSGGGVISLGASQILFLEGSIRSEGLVILSKAHFISRALALAYDLDCLTSSTHGHDTE